MDLIKVKSAAIQAIGYKGRTQVMQVLFAGGRLKVYRGVPVQTWQQFMDAPSKGRWFNAWRKKQSQESTRKAA